MKIARPVFAAAMLFALTALAHAECTEADQMAKMDRLGDLLTKLVQANSAKAGTISEAMSKAMTLEGDASCTELDKLIATAK